MDLPIPLLVLYGLGGLTLLTVLLKPVLPVQFPARQL